MLLGRAVRARAAAIWRGHLLQVAAGGADGVAMRAAVRMMFLMNTLTTLVCVPLLAAFAVLPAQAKQDVPAAPQKQGLISDTPATKADKAVQTIDAFIAKQKIDTKKQGWRTPLNEPPLLPLSADADYFWHMETAVGPMKIRYFHDTAPMHVSSGIYLARLGYYDGLNFHRIIPNFMAQGGCPEGSGRGNPGYFMEGEFKGGRTHNKAGILSTANTGRPKSEGSQFFITFGPTHSLDGKYTIWGEVVEGQQVLKELAKLGSSANNGMLDNGPKIVRTWIEVVAKPKAETADVPKAEGSDAKAETPTTEKPKASKLKKGVVRELSEGKKGK